MSKNKRLLKGIPRKGLGSQRMMEGRDLLRLIRIQPDFSATWLRPLLIIMEIMMHIFGCNSKEHPSTFAHIK